MNENKKIGAITRFFLRAVAWVLDGLQGFITFVASVLEPEGYALYIVAPYIGILGVIVFLMWFAFLAGSSRNFGKKLLTVIAVAVIEIIPFLDITPSFSFLVERFIHLTNKPSNTPAVNTMLQIVGREAAEAKTSPLFYAARVLLDRKKREQMQQAVRNRVTGQATAAANDNRPNYQKKSYKSGASFETWGGDTPYEYPSSRKPSGVG